MESVTIRWCILVSLLFLAGLASTAFECSRIHEGKTTSIPLRPQPNLLQLRGGGEKFQKTWRRAYMMKGNWTEVGGRVHTINGTEYYFYEYKENKKRELQEAIAKMKKQLLAQGVPKKRIASAKDQPRVLERMLDEAIWVLDIFKKEGLIPKSASTPELRKSRREMKKLVRDSKERKRARLKNETRPLLVSH